MRRKGVMGSTPGAVAGTPRLLLRLEGMVVLMVSVVLFARGDHSWWLFALLFLVPDLSFLGFLAGPRLGAASYNALHTYMGPLALAAVFLLAGVPVAIPLIWMAHIGFDRLLGYGLKYPSGFSDTHLGRIGSGARGRSGD
jgi:hypothetical protein